MARARGTKRWWLDDPRERYWVEALSERRPTLGHQLHAPQRAGGGQQSQSFRFSPGAGRATETRAAAADPPASERRLVARQTGGAPRRPVRGLRRGLSPWKERRGAANPLHVPPAAPRVLAVPFLDRFRRPDDPHPAAEPDDPRVTTLAAEMAAARGNTFPWLIWSGPLLGDSEAATEATALVRRRWWEFNANVETKLIEVDEKSAVDALTWLIGNTLAYDSELMTFERASALTATYVALMPTGRRWFGNSDDFSGRGSHYSFDPATDYTFDIGFVTVGAGRAWIAWFTDED
jgi:hypothetical protein